MGRRVLFLIDGKKKLAIQRTAKPEHSIAMPHARVQQLATLRTTTADVQIPFGTEEEFSAMRDGGHLDFLPSSLEAWRSSFACRWMEKMDLTLFARRNEKTSIIEKTQASQIFDKGTDLLLDSQSPLHPLILSLYLAKRQRPDLSINIHPLLSPKTTKSPNNHAWQEWRDGTKNRRGFFITPPPYPPQTLTARANPLNRLANPLGKSFMRATELHNPEVPKLFGKGRRLNLSLSWWRI